MMDYSTLGRPTYRTQTMKDHSQLIRLYKNHYHNIRHFPRKEPEEIRHWQFQKIKELVSHAYTLVPLYRQKYSAVGFHPGDLKSWHDFEQLPTVTKEELIASWPDRIIAKGYGTKFTTRSSGSSGQFVTVAVDKEAVMIDTLMGCRQLEFQSNEKITPEDETLFIYTCPWWFTSVGGMYRSLFIPSSTPVEDSAKTILALRPAALSLYPSYLRRLTPFLDKRSTQKMKVIIVHSEQSSARERKAISRELKVPVLDEYSSEELTRIALECPSRKYHLEDDAVYVEIIDSKYNKNVPPETVGEVIGTNLLNKATPLIRYQQGDLASLLKESSPCPCGSNYRFLTEIVGRKSDCFITPAGNLIASGTLMDLAYRWFLDLGIPVHGLQYEIIQKKSDQVEVTLATPWFKDQSKAALLIKKQLQEILTKDCHIKVDYVDEIPTQKGKCRPIRSEIQK